MFDIGFWELSVILVIALLVVGPERLPRVARTAGLYVGRVRRFVQSVKTDINRELAAEELKRALDKQSNSTGIHEIIEETRDLATDTEKLLNQPVEPDVESSAPDTLKRSDAMDPPHGTTR